MLYLSLVLLIFSCINSNSGKVETVKAEKPYQQIVAEELASGKRYDTIFLDFKFGMRENEVEKKFDDLMSKGKVFEKSTVQIPYLNTNITLFGHLYDFHLDTNIYQSIIQKNYYNDSLFIMTVVIFKGYDSNTYNKLIDLYKTKYGDFKKDTVESYSNKKTIWIKSNREIDITELTGIGISIEYTDLKTKNSKLLSEKKQKEIEQKKNVEKAKETKSNI
jgi:hypothetical protein